MFRRITKTRCGSGPTPCCNYSEKMDVAAGVRDFLFAGQRLNLRLITEGAATPMSSNDYRKSNLADRQVIQKITRQIVYL